MEKYFYNSHGFIPIGKEGTNFDRIVCISQDLKPQDVFFIAANTESKYHKILNNISRDVTLENSSIGDNYNFMQVKNYSNFIEILNYQFTRNKIKMNVIPIYYDKYDKGIKNFVDSEMPKYHLLREMGAIVIWIDYTDENFNLRIIKSLNEMEKSELTKKIIQAPTYLELQKSEKQ